MVRNLIHCRRSDQDEKSYLSAEEEHFRNSKEVHSEQSANHESRYISDYSTGKYHELIKRTGAKLMGNISIFLKMKVFFQNP